MSYIHTQNISDICKYAFQNPGKAFLTISYSDPGRNYMSKVNNTDTRTRCEICSKLTIKTLERSQWRHSGVFIVNFEHILRLVQLFLLLTLSR